MTASQKILIDLKKGKVVKTDNKSCSRYGTNQIPDAIRKLRRKGYDITTVLVSASVNGYQTRVAHYTLEI